MSEAWEGFCVSENKHWHRREGGKKRGEAGEAEVRCRPWERQSVGVGVWLGHKVPP